MNKQNYRNHIRFYTPHHFVFYPVMIVLVTLCIVFAFKRQEESLIWIFLAISLFANVLLSFMLRQHYALNNQNRIVRLEMRLRFFTLTGKRLEDLEKLLSFGQIAALRFASDEELPALLERALNNDLSSDEIKKAIKNWNPDHMRV